MIENCNMFNNNYKFKVKDLRLAEIREFSLDNNGASIDFYSYLFLIEKDGKYINPFSVDDTLVYPVFDRVRQYGNCTLDGIEFGTKIRHVQGEIQNGPCIVMSYIQINESFDSEELCIEDLQNYILTSDEYFKDREQIINERSYMNPIFKFLKNKKDKEYKEKLNRLMYEKGKQLRK